MNDLIRIAVVDDEEVFVSLISNKIRLFLQNKGTAFELQTFTSGSSLLEDSGASQYDLVFLDIEMPDVTGLDIARTLRRKQTSTEMIFVTNKDDLVYDTIRYTPFRFIRKQRFELEFDEALENYLVQRRNRKATCFFSTEHGKKPVNVISLVYIEVQSHKLTVHLQDGSFTANGNLGDVEKSIAQYGFIRIHNSFLVNFRYINLINQKTVTLDDGTALPMSRGRLETVKMDLMRFSRRL